MHRFLPTILLSLVTLFPLATASAKTITLDFEDLQPGPLLHGETWDLGSNILFENFSNSTVAQPGDYVGEAVEHGWEHEQCLQLQCTDNGSNYVAVVNDAAMSFSTISKRTFGVTSLRASFLGPRLDSYNPIVGAVRLLGVRIDGTQLAETFTFGPPGVDGYDFSNLSLSPAFASNQFTRLYIFGLACDSLGSCQGFDSDRAQFALDDLTLVTAAVPEPSTCLMLGVGMLLIARRRRA